MDPSAQMPSTWNTPAKSGQRPPEPRAARLMLPAGLLIALLFAGFMSLSLWQNYRDVSRQAARDGTRRAQALARDVAGQLAPFRLLLRQIAADYTDPGIQLSADTWNRVLTRMAAASEQAGMMLIADAKGDVIARAGQWDFQPERISGQPYFALQATQQVEGLFLSEPMSCGTARQPCVALSQALRTPDGRFAGVIAAVLPMAVLRDPLSEAASIDDLDDPLLLIRSEGGVFVLECPAKDCAQPVAPLAHMVADAKGTPFTLSYWGQQRTFYSEAIPGFPLVVAVGQSLQEAYLPWRYRMLSAVAAMLTVTVAAIAIALLLRHDLLRRSRMQAELLQLSMTDDLTGIANRRRFFDVASREWQRAQRLGAPVAVLMIDIDRFKLLNDRLGHAAGDAVLQAIAQLIRHNLRRPTDLVARYGGEEFTAILPDTDMAGAFQTAERIRTQVERDVIRGDHPVTVSIGIAAAAASPRDRLEDMIAGADRALYRAKESGRNRVVVERGELNRPPTQSDLAQAT